MFTVADVCLLLESLAPARLAAEWDNVGLLVGDRGQKVERMMTCLTVTPAVAAEAVRERVDLIITHHPLPFKPLKRLTSAEPSGRLLLDLIRAGIAIHSSHTAFDSAAAGINQHLAEGLGLTDIAPLIVPAVTVEQPQVEGTGRVGRLTPPLQLSQLAVRLKTFLKIGGLHIVGAPEQTIELVGIACGSAGELLTAAIDAGCQLFVTGETRLHTCYEAEANHVALLLPGHYASERFGVERLALSLASQLPGVAVGASRDERDPLAWL